LQGKRATGFSSSPFLSMKTVLTSYSTQTFNINKGVATALSLHNMLGQQSVIFFLEMAFSPTFVSPGNQEGNETSDTPFWEEYERDPTNTD
jgi:hypothetical protein